MNSIHYAVKQALLPVLLDATMRMREKYKVEDEVAQEKRKETDALVKWYKQTSNIFSNNIVDKMLELHAILLGRPDLKNIRALIERASASPVLDPFTVFATSDVLDAPLYICINGKHQHMLNTKGQVEMFSSSTSHIASDEQVETCVDELTPAQLRFILSNDLFAGVVEPILAASGETEEETETEEELVKNNTPNPPDAP